HKFEQRLEIGYNFFGVPLLCECRKIPDVEKHHANISLFASQIRFQRQQLVHDSRRNILSKRSTDPIPFLNHLKGVQNSFFDLARYKSGDDSSSEQEKSFGEMLRRIDQQRLNLRARFVSEQEYRQNRIFKSGDGAGKNA